MEHALNADAASAAAALRRLITERNITHIKVGFFDLDGVMAGKYMSTAKFLAALDNNYAFCDVVFGWDVNDQLFDNIKLSGWITGYADAEIRLLSIPCKSAMIRGKAVLMIVLSRPDMTFDNIKATVITRLR